MKFPTITLKAYSLQQLCAVTWCQLSVFTRRRLWGDAVVQAVTEPLFAAPPGQTHKLRVGAVVGGGLEVIAAQGHAGHPASLTGADVGAGRLEYLALLQPHAVVHLAAQLVATLSRCGGEERSSEC